MADATPGALARRRPRIADVPAAPVLAVLPLVPAKGPRTYVHLRGAGPGRVLIEAGGGAVIAAIEARGELVREVALPRSALLMLARRHGCAERLTVDGAREDDPPGSLLLRTLDATSAASVACVEAEAQPGTVASLLKDRPLLAGDERACLLNMQLLALAASTLRRLCPGAPTSCAMPRHDLIGAVLTATPDPDGDVVSAAVALARCVAVKPPHEGQE